MFLLVKLFASCMNLVVLTSCVSRQIAVATASDDGSADEGVTVVDSPTNCKSQSSPIAKKETA